MSPRRDEWTHEQQQGNIVLLSSWSVRSWVSQFKVWVKRFSEDPMPIQMERKSSSHISRSSIHSYLPQSIHLDPLLLVAPFATQILWCNSMHTIRQVIEQWVNATKCRGCNPLGCIEIHYSPLFPPGCSSMPPVILSPASIPIHHSAHNVQCIANLQELFSSLLPLLSLCSHSRIIYSNLLLNLPLSYFVTAVQTLCQQIYINLLSSSPAICNLSFRTQKYIIQYV